MCIFLCLMSSRLWPLTPSSHQKFRSFNCHVHPTYQVWRHSSQHSLVLVWTWPWPGYLLIRDHLLIMFKISLKFYDTQSVFYLVLFYIKDQYDLEFSLGDCQTYKYHLLVVVQLSIKFEEIWSKHFISAGTWLDDLNRGLQSLAFTKTRFSNLITMPLRPLTW